VALYGELFDADDVELELIEPASRLTRATCASRGKAKCLPV
jgi:hypothetical protein